MKYPYIVKHNGVWYPVGAEVPQGKAPEKVTEAERPAPATEQISKTDILRMNRGEAVKYAEGIGIEVTDEITARELKDEIIKKLGL